MSRIWCQAGLSLQDFESVFEGDRRGGQPDPDEREDDVHNKVDFLLLLPIFWNKIWWLSLTILAQYSQYQYFQFKCCWNDLHDSLCNATLHRGDPPPRRRLLLRPEDLCRHCTSGDFKSSSLSSCRLVQMKTSGHWHYSSNVINVIESTAVVSFFEISQGH